MGCGARVQVASINHLLWKNSTNHLLWKNPNFVGGSYIDLCGQKKGLPSKLCSGIAFARRNSVKQFKRDRKPFKNVDDDNLPSEDDYGEEGKEIDPSSDTVVRKSITNSSREVVLQACTITSGLIAALGIIIRQVSHIASMEGFPVLDCISEVSFDFEMWHLELITGLVVLVSSCRYLLLKMWPDFSESSDAANQQVLTSLQPLDYVIVAFLPGISEELLFRGALLPLFGLNWKSALVVATIFGVLHVGSGRKYSFAVWATFVGLAYGYATIISSSIIVPMASHGLNNLVGGIIWRFKSKRSS